jgi:hypothetical protein
VLPLKIHHLPKISIRPHLAILAADFAAEAPLPLPVRAAAAARDREVKAL